MLLVVLGAGRNGRLFLLLGVVLLEWRVESLLLDAAAEQELVTHGEDDGSVVRSRVIAAALTDRRCHLSLCVNIVVERRHCSASCFTCCYSTPPSSSVVSVHEAPPLSGPRIHPQTCMRLACVARLLLMSHLL